MRAKPRRTSGQTPSGSGQAAKRSQDARSVTNPLNPIIANSFQSEDSRWRGNDSRQGGGVCSEFTQRQGRDKPRPYWRGLVASLAFSLILPVAAFATAVPFISQPPVPAVIAPGGSGFNLTLNGTGFLPNATMNWTLVSNGIVTVEPALSLTCSIETQCTVVVPGSYYATAGTTVITVVNPGPPSLTSNFVLLPVTSVTTTVTVNRSDFAVGNNPVSVVAADFNGDGILDLAVANNSDSTISILLGNADGTFTVQPPITLTGVGPTALIAADFNNDGFLDLAVADNKSNRVGILLGHGDGTFGAETEFVVGSSPSSVAAGDFNGDGKLDLAVTNSASNTVSILLGKGDGTFNTKSDISLSSGSGPSAVAVGDLNLDGKLDLVVADKISGKVSVLLGNGDGTFQSHVDYAAGKSPTSVVIATFNESNHNIPDVVAVDSGGSQISYFKGVGDGTLNAAVPFATGSGPFQAMVGDFNGDGHLDVAVTDTSANSVTILLGNGNGTFQSPINLPLSGSPVGIAVGDFNGDGRLDFATADSASKTVSVELQSPTVLFQPTSVNFGNQNVGTTSSPARNVILTNAGSATLNIQSIAIAGTDSTDFAVQSTTCGSTLAVGANCTTALTFTPSAPGSRTAQLSVTDNAPNSPQTVNLSGTGISTTGPLASVSPSSLTFASQPVGTTSPSQPVTLSNLGYGSLAIASITFGGINPGDFGQTNGCGASLGSGASCTINVTFAPSATGTRTANLIITDNSGEIPGSTQSVSLTGTGTALTAIPVPQIDQPLVPDSVAPGSAQLTLTVNGAGFLTNATANWTIASGGTATTTPLATSCAVSTQCTAIVPASLVSTGVTAAITVTNPGPPARTSNVVFLPIGTSLTQLGLIDTDFAVGTNPQSVAVADFNGDGILDLAVVNDADSTVSILIGNGDGTFITPAPTYPTGAGPVWVIAGDFNNDGKQDLVVVDSAASTVSVLLGNGDGTFQAKIDSATGTAPTSVAAGDFNGDGFVDLAVADSSANTVSILLGNGDGTFKPKNDISTGTGSGPSAVAVADVNGDGLLDVVVAEKTNGKMSVLLGNGDGTFKTHVDYAADKAPSSLVVADFNGDGKPDVVVVDSGTNKISYFQGNGDGTFQTATSTSLTSGSGPAQVVALDLNEDGKLDLAVTGTAGNTISVLFGNGDGTFAAPTDFNTGTGPIGIAVGDFNGDGRLDLVTADSGAAKVSVQLQGPSVGLSASSLSFGNQSVGTTSAAQNVILTNTGSATLSIQSLAITGTNSTDFALFPSSTCGSTLAAASSCTISVTFTPTAAGVRTAQVAITDNALGSPQSVTLTGTGTQAAVTLSASSLTYSIPIDVGQKSVAQTVTLTNSGTDTLTFSSIAITGDINDFAESNDCLNPPANLAPNASCHISVTFEPTATGTRTGTVTINDNAPGTPQSISLTGQGVIPTATLAPTILTFPSQLVNSAAPSQSITITNSGSGPLLITSISITGANTGDFSQTNTCGTQVGAGASCTITVTFTPTAVGPRTAAVTVIDNNNGVNGNPDVVTLSGVGIAPIASLSSTSLDFGNQSIGTTSAAQTVTLNNTGTAPLTVASIVSSSGEFGQSSSGCTPTVAAGASCTITVTFTPSLAGTQNGTITITDNNNGTAGSTQTISVTGVGAAASITLTPSTLNFGNQTVGTTSNPQTITVTNTGSGADTINNIAATPSTNFTETDTCPRSSGGLAASATCTVTVTFTPKAGGQYNGSLQIADTSAGSPHTASLSGMGSDFAVSVTPTSSTTAAGDSSTFTIQLTPSGGFNQQITLSCSGLPQLSACSFSPASTVTLDGTNSAGLTMNVTTTAPSMLAPVDLNRRPPDFWKFHLPPIAVLHSTGEVSLLVMWFLAIATIVGWHALARRRASLGFAVAVLALLIAGSAAMSACGGGGGTVLPRPGTPVGTYSITITGASGTLSHTTTVTLTVD